MSQSRLTKRLRREISANPKKALFLGLLILAAIYFWAPLVCGWLAKDDSPTKTAAADPAAGSPATVPQEPKIGPKKETEGPRFSWQQLVQWMDNDPRTSVALPLLQQRDPFVTPMTQIVQDKTQEEKSETADPDVTPESLGMVLSSTIIGPRRRLARISGKTYKLGQTVRLDKDGQQIAFALVEVHPRRVVLEREGKKFDLKIPSRDNSGRIELVGSTKNP